MTRFFLCLLLLLLYYSDIHAQPSGKDSLFHDLTKSIVADSTREAGIRYRADSTQRVFWNSLKEMDELVSRKENSLLNRRYSENKYSPDISMVYDDVSDSFVSITVIVYNDLYDIDSISRYLHLNALSTFSIIRDYFVKMDLSWTPYFAGNEASYADELQSTIGKIYTLYRNSLPAKYQLGYPEKYWSLEQSKKLNLNGRIKYRKQFIKLLESNCGGCGRLD